MPGIENAIIGHHLCVDPTSKKVQKKRSFSTEKYVAIAKEADQLLDMRLIKEGHYHEWLSNVVLLKEFIRK